MNRAIAHGTAPVLPGRGAQRRQIPEAQKATCAVRLGTKETRAWRGLEFMKSFRTRVDGRTRETCNLQGTRRK